MSISFRLAFLFVLLTASLHSTAQRVTCNHLVDETKPEIKEVLVLFKNYLASAPEKGGDNPYWDPEEAAAHKHFDFLESEFEPSLYMGMPVHILSISSKEGLYKIKAQFSYCKENGVPYVLAIVNYFAEKREGKFYLKNALLVNRLQWNHSQVGLVDFYYPKEQVFHPENAEKLNQDILEICRQLGIEAIPFEYYFAEDYETVQALKGFDYYLGMGGESKPTGKASDDKVYCGGLGENYLHEVYHVQVDPHYPGQHGWVSEGMACFLGGSRGQDLDWHIRRAQAFLKRNPQIDLNELLKYKNIDEYTSYHYVFGGLIARKIFEKGSWPLIKEFLNTGKKDQDYYQAIQKYLGVPKHKLNTYLRALLEEEVTK